MAKTDLEVGLLTGGTDWAYSFGLTEALTTTGVSIEFIGSDGLDNPQLHALPRVTFLNLRGSRRADVGSIAKVTRVVTYYSRLIRYAATARPRLFHILWNNKFEYLDRTLLMLFYRMQGKKVVLTAHNVNTRKRDGSDSFLNRLTLKTQYRLAAHIFVHTEKMKTELADDFAVEPERVTVIPHPVNSAVPITHLTGEEAKRRLGVSPDELTLLFFGRIAPYKGLEYLLEAFALIRQRGVPARLIVAGRPKEGSEDYWRELHNSIARGPYAKFVTERIEFVPEEDTEIYFKGSDALILPYTDIFQSGVLFLSYTFGLPVVASDVGSFREDITEGSTGLICQPKNAFDLARALEEYYRSRLFRDLQARRPEIREWASRHHSWDAVASLTRNVYSTLLRTQS